MNRPFPMTRVAWMGLYQLLRLYFALPWWGMLIVATGVFLWAAKG